MTDLEKMISELRIPGPSKQLDQRMAELLQPDQNSRPVVVEVPRSSNIGNATPSRASFPVRVVALTSLAASLAGFFAGRSSTAWPEPVGKSSEVVASNRLETTLAVVDHSKVVELQEPNKASTSSNPSASDDTLRSVVWDSDPLSHEKMRRFVTAQPAYESLWGNLSNDQTRIIDVRNQRMTP